MLDDFRPDVVVIWGDDQHENFTEDVIPPFCVLAYDQVEARPWQRARRRRPTSGASRPDTAFRIRAIARPASTWRPGCSSRASTWRTPTSPLHHPGLAHAFLNTIMFLDYDRVGFPYPVIAFQVNCYGRRVIAQRGGRGSLASPLAEAELDPPVALAEALHGGGRGRPRASMRDSPWRMALIASSSWSHAFLTDKHHQLYPDIESDRRLYEALRAGDYETWRQTPLAAIEASGQQEMLNWFMLAGAMEELGRKPDECEFIETWSFNSNKCFSVWKP